MIRLSSYESRLLRIEAPILARWLFVAARAHNVRLWFWECMVAARVVLVARYRRPQ